ncbi:hypothetical protein FEM48_Zijuj09G0211400 [Ziziphus jujuba var. spinosa]|uniref:Disease resistance R13L4/SHOC-2-like LRR domain-containing protein n=1 Tax=Ziziphus jujuba var. spinosa TaxID=714518 RepID=A0A978UVB9_ZIZJJ|nr:hypothetical protein FEM48_Zijuj09G0211400 [Ziziphus jujuba var. spinosa]
MRSLTSLSLREITFGNGGGGYIVLSHLEVLNSNGFTGPIPEDIQNLTSLVHLDLSFNFFNTSIPSWLYSLSHLEVLILSDNEFRGPIPEDIQNLTSLVHLDLSYNSFNTSIPSWLYSLSHLEVLNLAGNQLRGTISSEIKNMTSIITLDLSKNELQGDLPTSSMAQLCKLKEIDLSGNTWKRSISQILDSCSGCLSDSLQVLNIRDGQIYDVLPAWIFNFSSKLEYLDLSQNQMHGRIPAWIFNFSSELEYLDLSQNQMHGRIPNLTDMGTQEYSAIDLSQNHFEGPLPLVSSKLYKLDLSDNLLSGTISQFLCSSPSQPMNMAALYLAKNRLSGKLPNCWSKWKNIQVLYLNYNSFGGGIPSSFGSFIFLRSLHLRSNNLSGILSLSDLQNCIDLVILDLSGNKFGGNIPTWLGTGPSMLRFLSAGFNEFHGHIPDELCALNSLQILDLSNNNLSGPIPKCFNNFFIMAIKGAESPGFWYSVSRRSSAAYVEAALLLIKGKPIEYNRTLELVNIIDLSGNSLSGHISLEITNLSNLLSLNLSNNLLDGKIPVKIDPNGHSTPKLQFIQLCRQQTMWSSTHSELQHNGEVIVV